jgi:hypothetical protein
MINESDNLNQKIKKFLPIYLLVVYVTTITGSIAYALECNHWTIGDWLINYQGGFVRRGFIGEIIYILSSSLNISPAFFVILFHSLFYWIFLFFSRKILEMEKNLLPFGLLIMSPFLFTFQIYDMGGGYRKEIIFFALLAWFTYLAKSSNQKFKKIFFAILVFVYPLIVLSHEMLFLLLFYLIAVYLITSKPKIKINEIVKLIIASIPSVIAFIFTIVNHGDINKVKAIYSSLEKLGYKPEEGGAIFYLQYSAFYAFRDVIQILIKETYYIFIYILTLILISIAFIPLRHRLSMLLKNREILTLLGFSLILFLPMFFVAKDWGRWIYIHAVSLFFILTLYENEGLNTAKLKFIPKRYIFLAVLYSQLWIFPHYIGQNIRWPFINILYFLKPPIKILIHFNPDIKEKMMERIDKITIIKKSM